MSALFITLLTIYIIDIMGLFYFAAHLYLMVYLYLKNRDECRSDAEVLAQGKKAMKEWPLVTIQLPLFNEYYVLERVIDSSLAIDYPKEKLQIQVLDDSTDDSIELARRKVAEYRKKGFDIQHLHRKNRIGHKAGALKAGLEQAKGEFIAIFDADFIPAREFLKSTIPYFFARKKVGMVQTRWGHINPDYSPLTRAQSIGIDGHFIIEHTARNGSGLWMNFNGTAGVWKKECILDAGNWEHDTLTEDFDLSYRALLKGWNFSYLWDVVSPAELPPTISAFKSQQFRWCKGSIQTARKLLPTIVRSKLPLKIKMEAFTHLMGYTVHPLILLNILLILPILILRRENDIFSIGVLIGSVAVMTVSTLAPIFFYSVSQKSLYSDWRKRLSHLPILTMIGTGIAINNTRAWLEALTGKVSSFVRTPKLKIDSGDTSVIDKISDEVRYLNFKISFTTMLELALGFYIAFTIYFAFKTMLWYPSPFLVLYGAGFFYVAYLAIADAVKSSRSHKKRVRAKEELVKAA